jgi:uncharacterized protein YigE (DUF2233 family)
VPGALFACNRRYRRAILAAAAAAASMACGKAGTGCSRSHDSPDAAAVRAALDAGEPGADTSARDGVTAFTHANLVVRKSVDLREAELRVVDVQMSRALKPLFEASHAEFVVNGGFFDPELRPLGLAISNSLQLSRHTQTPGGVLAVSGGHATLYDAEHYALNTDANAAPSFAIQCLPRLVVDKQVNLHRDTGKRAERTALCIRDEGHTLEAVYARGDGERPHPTLLEFAEFLLATGCEHALNLDGGPSAGLVTREASSETIHAEGPRGPVRHAIVAVRR